MLSSQEVATLDEIKRCLTSYGVSTKTSCFAIDLKGVPVFASGQGAKICNLCKNGCSGAHLYGSYQAERFGGKYIYFCPIGLAFWATPLTLSPSSVKALIGGPILMMSPEEFLLDDLIRKIAIDEERIRLIFRYIAEVPVTEPDIVNNLAELLSIIGSAVSEKAQEKHGEQKAFHHVQAKISETIHSIKFNGENLAKPNLYPYNKEKELINKIAIGDKQESQKILNELLGYVFFSSGSDFEVIKARILELVVVLSRAALEGGADSEEIFGLNFIYLAEIHNFKKIDELTFWLSKILARFNDCVFNLANIRHKDTIFKAIAYIKNNYMNRITLEDVAGHVYLNPSYFSKIFNAEIKTPFASYVNSYRLQAAKRLLLESNESLAEISTLSGFEDQSYFTKVFKKAFGITPGKFRESRGH